MIRNLCFYLSYLFLLSYDFRCLSRPVFVCKLHDEKNQLFFINVVQKDMWALSVDMVSFRIKMWLHLELMLFHVRSVSDKLDYVIFLVCLNNSQCSRPDHYLPEMFAANSKEFA